MKPETSQKWRQWLCALTNPRLLFCLAVGWFITNGWSYCALGAGVFFEIHWLRNLATVYLGLLWLPGTPEKLLTVGIAIGLLRLWFPEDTRTLALLKDKQKQIAAGVRKQYSRLKSWIKRRKGS